jgi:CBS domain-containing protein
VARKCPITLVYSTHDEVHNDAIVLRSSVRASDLTRILTRMFIEQMLSRARERFAIIGAGARVREAVDLMSRPHTDGGMVGVVTKTDIVGQIGQCEGLGCVARVDTIMTRSVVWCQPNDVLHDIWSLMKERGLQRIPVIGRGRKSIGILYARDALQNLLGVNRRTTRNC